MQLSSIEIPNRPYWQPKLGAVGKTVVGLEDVAQGIEILFSTLPGSVPLLPEYGFDWLKFMDKPINSVLRRIEREMIKCLRRWEQRIEVVSVKAEPLYEAFGSVIVCLTWKLKGSNEAVIQVLGLGRAA